MYVDNQPTVILMAGLQACSRAPLLNRDASRVPALAAPSQSLQASSRATHAPASPPDPKSRQTQSFLTLAPPILPQGVGKTTACGKLALYLKNQGRKVLMVATDVYRPAAIEQLEMLGKRCDVPVFSMGTDAKPEDIAAAGVVRAREGGFDTIIVDTAGRLTVRANAARPGRRVLNWRHSCQQRTLLPLSPAPVAAIVPCMWGVKHTRLPLICFPASSPFPHLVSAPRSTRT